MKYLIDFPPTEKFIEQFARNWVTLLAKKEYSKACELIHPSISANNGSLDAKEYKTWTPNIIESIIKNMGTMEPQEDEYSVCELSSDMEQEFLRLLDFEIYEDDEIEEDEEEVIIADLHINLPLNYPSGGTGLYDLTARFYLTASDVEDKAELHLEDIHVM